MIRDGKKVPYIWYIWYEVNGKFQWNFLSISQLLSHWLGFWWLFCVSMKVWSSCTFGSVDTLSPAHDLYCVIFNFDVKCFTPDVGDVIRECSCPAVDEGRCLQSGRQRAVDLLEHALHSTLHFQDIHSIYTHTSVWVYLIKKKPWLYINARP